MYNEVVIEQNAMYIVPWVKMKQMAETQKKGKPRSAPVPALEVTQW